MEVLKDWWNGLHCEGDEWYMWKARKDLALRFWFVRFYGAAVFIGIWLLCIRGTGFSFAHFPYTHRAEKYKVEMGVINWGNM